MWIILLIVLAGILAGILAGYSLRMCAFLKKVNLTISCTICLMLFVLGLSVGYNPLIGGLQSVDCRKLGVFRRTGVATQCGRHYGKRVAGTRGISVVF